MLCQVPTPQAVRTAPGSGGIVCTVFPTRAATGITKAYFHDMSPPPLSRAGEAPPPRQKSCLACIKAKRRCDQRVPACLRCAQRRATCVYSHPVRTLRARVRGVQGQPTPEHPPPAVHSASEQSHEEHEIPGDMTIDYDFCAAVDASTVDPLFGWPDDQAHLAYGDSSGVQQAAEPTLIPEPFQEWSLMAPFGDVSLLGDVAGKSVFPSQTTLAEAAPAPHKPACEITPTGHFNMEIVTAELDCKLAYSVERIKSAPKTMLTELQTPWCHPSLYKDDMPTVMQGQ